MKLLLALFCLLLPLIATPAEAANAWNERDLAWAAPTTCDEGSPLTQCPITGYRIEAAGDCAATKWNTLVSVGKVTNYHATNLAAGTYCFRAVALSARESLPSPTTAASRTTVTASPTCPPQPASETRSQACVAPMVGSWSQTRVPQRVEPPACWEMGAWTPDTAPDGMCATPRPMVTISTVAYMEVQRPNGFGFLPIGTVPLGVLCDETQSVNQFHVVKDASLVTFTGPIKRIAVLVLCG